MSRHSPNRLQMLDSFMQLNRPESDWQTLRPKDCIEETKVSLRISPDEQPHWG